NWRGRPLRTYETVVSLIANTTNRGGLVVRARIDRRKYATGKTVSDLAKRRATTGSCPVLRRTNRCDQIDFDVQFLYSQPPSSPRTPAAILLQRASGAGGITRDDVRRRPRRKPACSLQDRVIVGDLQLALVGFKSRPLRPLSRVI